MTIHHVAYGREHPGTPIVLLGSIASTTDMWLPQLDELSVVRPVIAFDHPGHGLSPDPAGTTSVTTIASLAAGVTNALDELGIDRFIVVGLSLGGAIAQYLAATSGRVDAAALLCTAAYFGGPEKWRPRAALTRAEGLAPMREGILDLWVTPEFRTHRPATSDFYRRMISSTRGIGYAACADALAGWDFRDRLAEITCPVLTLAGRTDQSTPPATLAALANAVSGPAHSIVVDGAHLPTVESARAVTAALREFVSK